MAELDNIPQTQSIEIASVKLDEETRSSIEELNQRAQQLIMEFGQMYVRRKELSDELMRLDEFSERAEDDFKAINAQLRDMFEALDEKYPQGRYNPQDGTMQYQPGAPTRRQLAEQQQAGGNPNQQMKVVKD
jgi:predicted nuclease with TOPRIM domain